MTGLAAITWGSAGVLMFVPGDLAYQALLICVVMGLSAGAATSNPFHPPSMFIYLIGMILPLLGRLAWENDANALDTVRHAEHVLHLRASSPHWS